jgi:hypothetical protein
METPRAIPGDGLLHPVALAALAVMVVNDHWLKAHSPGFVTGKLSDVAGLLFFPLLLQAAYELVFTRREVGFIPSLRVALACCVATGLVFTLTQLWAPGALAFEWGLALLQWPARALLSWAVVPLRPVAHVADAEDLIALPALLVAFTLARRRAHTARVS